MRPLSRTSDVFLLMVLINPFFFSPSDRQYRRNNAFGSPSVRHGFDDRDGAVERLALSPRTSNIVSSKQIPQSICAMMNLSSLYENAIILRTKIPIAVSHAHRSARPPTYEAPTLTMIIACDHRVPPALWLFSSVAFVCFGFRFFFLFFSFSSIVFRTFGL